MTKDNSKPNCYVPNNDPYPLGIGNGSEKCRDCCFYEDMNQEGAWPCL